MLPIWRNSLIVLLIVYTVACNVVADMKTNDVSPAQAQAEPAKRYLVTSNGKYGFIDPEGKLTINLPDDVYTVGHFSEGLAVIAKEVPNTFGRWGFIDESGRVVIEPKFNLAKPFSEGLAAIVMRESDNSGGSLGYIDKTGRIVIQPQFGTGGVDSDFAFSEGLSAVPLPNDKWGYIDKTGKFVITATFKYAAPFSEGRAWVGIAEPDWSIKFKFGMIDKEGHWIVQPRFDGAGRFSEGLASIRLNNKIGYINREGEIVIKVQFDADGGCPDLSKREAGRFSEGLAAVQENWKWGFIDHSGRFVINPSYDCAQNFNEGLAVIGVRDEQARGWRYGYIDKSGAIVIEPRFTSAGAFSGGLAHVGVGMTVEGLALMQMEAAEAGKTPAEIEKETARHNMKLGYIDKSGKFVWEPTN